MIRISKQFDLGRDRTRMKDPADAARQEATVQALLERFFDSDLPHRFETQILADEVGMGKTFVALGVAYSILAAMKSGGDEPDLKGCCRKILVLTPQNHALWQKWGREIGEFAKRCVFDDFRKDAEKWFAPLLVDRLDDLAAELGRGSGPGVIVANLGIFKGQKLKNYDLKRRLLLGTLFRFWSNGFPIADRERLLRGAPEDWGRAPNQLTVLNEKETTLLPILPEEMYSALKRHCETDGSEQVDHLKQLCRDIAKPFTRGREERFSEIDHKLTKLYRALIPYIIRKSLPLVIVDEGHNWKNHNNGYEPFRKMIAPKTRRLLLLTATPFQLRPSEVLSILEVSDAQEICAKAAESEARRDHLRVHRENVIRQTLERAEKASLDFGKEWQALPPNTDRNVLDTIWSSRSFRTTRTELFTSATEQGLVDESEIRKIANEITTGIDPAYRAFLREALLLYTYNADLSQELGEMLIRHRRQTQHRAFLIGDEYRNGSEQVVLRPDRHVVHSAEGIDVIGDAELPHYILMRCVSEIKEGKGRSSLGSALTGCYSTLLDSAEGKSIEALLCKSEVGAAYYRILKDLVKPEADKDHPKVKEVVDAVVERWKSGEKSLIFCFRINTAERLREIIDRRIRTELNRRRGRCLGGEEALKALRSRLTARDRDLVVLGLDRVLLSYLQAFPDEVPYTVDDLEMTEEDISQIAKIALGLGIDLESDRADRVFLNRAAEHVIARRLLKTKKPKGPARRLLEDAASPTWVQRAYGMAGSVDAEDGGEEQSQSDERGVHIVYAELIESPPRDRVLSAKESLLQRWQNAKVRRSSGILDAYANAPSLWFGTSPRNFDEDTEEQRSLVEKIHRHLWEVTLDGEKFDWDARRQVFQALRRTLLRESVLLRILPDRSERDESGWGVMLVERFFGPLKNQKESMADRIEVFLEDIKAASGSISADVGKTSARQAILEATRLSDQQFVALVSGGKSAGSRERIFAGFNSPLLPEVLICTSVGQEGIDLHRHCRHVIHYDLPWNPAILEQRTGRTDRIGSKTFRERARAGGEKTFLEIGVPFLAGTYDERMFEELRLRAQIFEVLTGGDLAADNPEGDDEKKDDAPDLGRLSKLVALPEQMVRDLRVNLAVWRGNVQ